MHCFTQTTADGWGMGGKGWKAIRVGQKGVAKASFWGACIELARGGLRVDVAKCSFCNPRASATTGCFARQTLITIAVVPHLSRWAVVVARRPLQL